MSKLNIAIVGLCVFAAGLLLALLVVACQPRLPGSTQEAQEAQEAHEGTVEEVAQAKPASGGASDIVDGDLLSNKIIDLLPVDSPPKQAWPRIRFEDPDRVPRTWTYSGRTAIHSFFIPGRVYVCDDPELRLLVIIVKLGIAAPARYEVNRSILMTQKRTPAGVWESHGKFLAQDRDGCCQRMYYNMGELTGRHQVWWPNGQLRFDESWLNGQEEGLHRGWYESGQKAHEINYVNGVEVSGEAWDEDGELRYPVPVPEIEPRNPTPAGNASDIMDGDLLGNKIVALLPPADSPPGQAWPRIKFENPEFGVQTWTHSERVDPRSYRTFHSMSGAVYVCDGPLVIPEWRAQDETTLSTVDVRLLVLIGGHATHESILVAEKRTPGGDWEPHGKCVIRDKDGGYGSGYHDTGELAGRWEMCWSNGQPRIREYWKDGREVGMELAWYENGQKRYEIRHYSNGTDMMGETWDIAGAHQVFSHMDGKILLDGEWREDGQRRLFHSLTKGNSSWTSPKK